MWCVKTDSSFWEHHYIVFYIFVLEKVKWTRCHWGPFQAIEGLYMPAPHSLTHAAYAHSIWVFSNSPSVSHNVHWTAEMGEASDCLWRMDLDTLVYETKKSSLGILNVVLFSNLKSTRYERHDTQYENKGIVNTIEPCKWQHNMAWLLQCFVNQNVI